MESIYKAFANQGGDMMTEIKRQYEEFARTFSGDPRAEVMRMLQSGQISQAQLNEVQGIATRLFSAIYRNTAN